MKPWTNMAICLRRVAVLILLTLSACATPESDATEAAGSEKAVSASDATIDPASRSNRGIYRTLARAPFYTDPNGRKPGGVLDPGELLRLINEKERVPLQDAGDVLIQFRRVVDRNVIYVPGGFVHAMFDPPDMKVEASKMGEHFIITLTMDWQDTRGLAVHGVFFHSVAVGTSIKYTVNDDEFTHDEKLELTFFELDDLSRPEISMSPVQKTQVRITPDPKGTVVSGRAEAVVWIHSFDYPLAFPEPEEDFDVLEP